LAERLSPKRALLPKVMAIPPGQDKRAHPRLSAPVRAFVLSPDGRRAEYPVRDLSAGGLFIFTTVTSVKVGDRLRLELSPLDRDLPVQLDAQVARLVPPEPERPGGLGLYFVDVLPAAQTALKALLHHLLHGKGGERRAYPRVAHRVAVECTGAKDVRGVLRDLSLGGAGLFVEAPVALGERVTLRLTAQERTLTLPARVISTRWGLGGEPYDQAGLEFTDLDAAQKAALSEFLDVLMER
jgi:c-di-GMP-binding flagellar brake protein YcgR